MSHTPSAADDRNQTPGVDGALVKMRGTVEQIISSPTRPGSDVVQIVIEGAEPLYREIRIRNHWKDAKGRVVALQTGSEVEITIKLDTKTMPSPSTP